MKIEDVLQRLRELASAQYSSFQITFIRTKDGYEKVIFGIYTEQKGWIALDEEDLNIVSRKLNRQTPLETISNSITRAAEVTAILAKKE